MATLSSSYTPAASPRLAMAKRLALGGVALSAATLATLGLYGHHAATFHHDTTRLLAEITGAAGVKVTLRDTAGLSVHGMLLPKATSTPNQLAFDGRLSYDLAGAQYNFTLVDDKAFVTVEDLTTGELTRSECLRPDDVPPVATLTEALQNGRVVDAVGDDKVSCPSGKMVEFVFAGEPYVLCSNPTASREGGPGEVSVHGDDISASLQILSQGSEGIPSLASLSAPAGLDLATCAPVTTATGDASLVPTTTSSDARRLLQRTQDALQVAIGGRRLSKMAAPACTCKDGFKECLFVHGLGFNAGPTTSSFKEYFGTIEQQTQCCSNVKFLHIDTMNTPWYGNASTEAVCDAAVAMTRAKDKMAIEKVAIIAHSMGNLVVQAAFMNKKCALGKNSKYIALAGPMYGSASAASALAILNALPELTIERLCTNSPFSVLDNQVVNLLLSFGLCPTRISISSIAFKGSRQSTPELDKLLTAVGEQFGKTVSSSLCAVSPSGLASGDSAQLNVLGKLSGHASAENDGQVDFASCRATIPASRYANTWEGGKFYKASINHLDATFRNGDGWWGEDRKPIKWFNCQF